MPSSDRIPCSFGPDAPVHHDRSKSRIARSRSVSGRDVGDIADQPDPQGQAKQGPSGLSQGVPSLRSMALTKQLGDIAEAAIMADVLRRGYRVALPYGEDWPFDLLVLRGEQFERVQCKYGRSDGHVLLVACRSSNNWV